MIHRPTVTSAGRCAGTLGKHGQNASGACPKDRPAGDFRRLSWYPMIEPTMHVADRAFPSKLPIITLLFQFKPDPLVVIQERLDFMTQKPVVLVTGSSTGFGRLIVETVAKSG